jgi:thioesterase domain-containing protein
VVIVREDVSGDPRLVAYVVPSDPKTAPSSQDLTDALARRLPPYLVPSRIVLLQALPLTANGKLDTGALPGTAERNQRAALAPEPNTVDVSSDSRAPIDEWEQRLQGLWQKLLRVDDVGCQDNFFELGGHSLLAIRMIDAIDKEFGRTLSIASFFHAPSIRDQALLLRQQRTVASCVIAVQSQGKCPPLFVVPGYGGAVTPFHGLAKALGADQPLYLVDLNSVGCEPPQTVTIEGVAAQVVESMRRVQPHGPYYLAGYSLGGRIAYEIAQQLREHGEAIGLLAMLDCGAPGYPRVQSFMSRTFLHIRQGLRLRPGESRAYFAARVRSLRKYIMAERAYPPVFAENVVEKAMAAARAIEARSQVLYDAWLAYEPRAYQGALSIIRATVRPALLGVVDDDPHLGWGRLVGKRIRLAHIDCEHMKMLDHENLPALAKLLRGWLGGAAQPSPRREAALTA